MGIRRKAVIGRWRATDMICRERKSLLGRKILQFWLVVAKVSPVTVRYFSL